MEMESLRDGGAEHHQGTVVSHGRQQEQCTSMYVCLLVCVCLCMHASVCAANSEQKTFFVALTDNKRIQKQLLDCFRKDLDNALARNAQEQLRIYIIICNVNHYEAPQPTNKLTGERVTQAQGSASPYGLYITCLKYILIHLLTTIGQGLQILCSLCADDPKEKKLLRYPAKYIHFNKSEKYFFNYYYLLEMIYSF